MTDTEALDLLGIHTIRTPSMDAVQAARSGHPGTPMAMAPVAYCLWQRFLRFDPEDPIWPNRDRFVLPAGHASMLLYSLLHLTGTKAVDPRYERLGTPSVSLEDIRRFRQLESKCPGHPEYRWTSGVECTTGPLGQGVATSVGMAIGARWLAARYNRPRFPLFDYNVYALCGDGCLMEGISGEAASLAGHLGLANLCWIYDNNYIFTHDSIGVGEDGPTHQPVEHLASLRAIPGLITIRPCDANEVVEAWRAIMELHHEPAALVLSRQALPTLDRSRFAPASGLDRGAYVLADPPDGAPDVILIGTGSEVHLCIDALSELQREGVRVRIVSMPSWELFDRQSEDYRHSVLPPSVAARVAVEQASTLGWERYVGTTGEVVGMRTFGASAPLKELQHKFGFTPARVVAAAREQVRRHGR